ncbi:MAG: 50S ribosomal protein L11 methyltransferase [Rhodocyclaceae bacterium]|nr:50S ribosomal protein L11 methyltransferase [Rhodocyclaceae bacterium]
MSLREVVVEIDADKAEALAMAFEEAGALSVSWEDADAGTEREIPQFAEPDAPLFALWPRCRLTALFAQDGELEARIRAALRTSGLPAEHACSVRELSETDWVRATQAQFSPIAIAAGRLWIVPSWCEPPDPQAPYLVLDPGLAFGTGSHPTTRLCLAWLLEEMQPDMSLLDYGTGSGILAIAAKKLGAGTVVGVDIDEVALETAQRNAERNGVAIAWLHSSAPITQTFERVVANILTNPLKLLAPALAARLKPGGRLALSGVLETQADDVIAAYAPYLSLGIGAVEEGWVRLEGEKR